MKAIEIKLNHEALEPLIDSLGPVLKKLEHEAALALPVVDDDDELEEIWCQGLIHTQVEDCRRLMELFGERFRKSGVVLIQLDEADHLLRAASAIRLKVRELMLPHLPDSALEGAGFDFSTLEEPDRAGFAIYLFLATFQELIIRHLDG